MSRLGSYEENTIVVGDCLDIMAQMLDGCVDLVVTSPPYPMAKMWVDGEIPEFAPVFRAISGIMKNGSSLLVVVNDAQVEGMSFLDWDIAQWCIAAYLTPRCRFIWHKTGFKPFGRYAIDHRHEYVLWFSKGESQLNDLTDKPVKTSTVWEFERYESNQPKREGSSWHKAPFCKALVDYILRLFSNPGDLIFDPFMGSGTTAVVADRLGRKFFGCDTNPVYVEMALERLEKDRAGRQLELL